MLWLENHQGQETQFDKMKNNLETFDYERKRHNEGELASLIGKRVAITQPVQTKSIEH